MLTLDTPCEKCEGKGRVSHAVETVPMLPDMSTWDPTALREDTELDLTKDHSVVDCHSCKNIKGPDGVSYARYRDRYDSYPQPYKSTSSLKAAITRGKARKCHRCRGLGRVAQLPIITDCWTCSGRGMRVTWNPDVDPILPPEVSDCDNASTEFIEAWLRTATVVVLRENRGATWGEMHLGIGGMYSITDYGKSWASDDSDVILDVVEHLVSSPPQFIKMLDRPTRRFGTLLLINITRGGHTPMVADTRQARPALPPTYTDAVLNRIVT